MSKRKHPPISIHSTLNGHLEVDWEQAYQGEYSCPHCNAEKLKNLLRDEEYICRLKFICSSCKKYVSLTCGLRIIGGARRKYPAISIHETLDSTRLVNWGTDYQGEYSCPLCNEGQIINAYYHKDSICHLRLACNTCRQYSYLSCPLPNEIYNYLPNVSCPNPLCAELGPHGQKGWIYLRSIKSRNKAENCRCHFCGIVFDPAASRGNSWAGSQQQKTLQPFEFKEDVWDLRHFFENPQNQFITFKDIEPAWLRQYAKQYLYQILESKTYRSVFRVSQNRALLNQFGKFLQKKNIHELVNLSRKEIVEFLDTFAGLTPNVRHARLAQFKLFLEWLGLDAKTLIKQRNFPKFVYNPPDWLDEPTRTAIREHLHKIPAPIARHYLVQEFTAARTDDICQIGFDCLIEENGKWYIQFHQNKVQRWHKVPANRQIRKVIEEQQQWIRQTLGADYAYLFCHFRSFKAASYPSFPSIKPLPKPPLSSGNNPMVRIIQYMIEAEDIRDSNNQQAKFTGKITRSSRLQEVRTKHGVEAAQLYADHVTSKTTLKHYAPPTQEQIAQVDLPFQELLLNLNNRFLPWQSLPESLLKNPTAHELDLEIAPRLTVYGHCALNPKTPCPFSLYPKCYDCHSFRPSTGKLALYEQQYAGEIQRMEEAQLAGAELAYEEAKATIEAMDTWLPQLRKVANEAESGETNSSTSQSSIVSEETDPSEGI